MDGWRLKAVEMAFQAFSLPIVDGTPEGEAWIEDYVIDPLWDPDDKKEYGDGKHAWCGDFLYWCWAEAGFRPPMKLSSPGRLLYPFACYWHGEPGSMNWCVIVGPGGQRRAVELSALHRELEMAGRAGAERKMCRLRDDGTFVGLDEDAPRAGDAFFWQNEPNSWRGHVMMVLAQGDQNLTVVDGNGAFSTGPSKEGKEGLWVMKRRDGVGVRTYGLEEFAASGRPAWIVRPSVVDFSDEILSYHPTQDEAQAAAAS